MNLGFRIADFGIQRQREDGRAARLRAEEDLPQSAQSDTEGHRELGLWVCRWYGCSLSSDGVFFQVGGFKFRVSGLSLPSRR